MSFRLAAVLVPALILAICSGCTFDSSGSSSTDLESVSDISFAPEVSHTPGSTFPGSTLIGGVPSDGARLAFAMEGDLFIIAEGQDPVSVGPEGSPTWSSSGRYLAWSVNATEWSGDLTEDVNAPRDSDVIVLDTESGQRVLYRSENLLSGLVLAAAGDQFVLLVSGENNLGREATSFEIVSFDEIVAEVTPTHIVAKFEFEDSAIEHDFLWVAGHGDHLYVQTTLASGTWYRYDPTIWRVGLDGASERLFGECDDSRDGCLSNRGFSPLAISPNGDFVALNGGNRNGCEVYSAPTLTPIDSYDPIALDGLPKPVEGIPQTTGFRSITWETPGQFLAVVTHRGMPSGDQRCSYPEISPDTVYRCNIEGQCETLGIEASWAATGPNGELVTVPEVETGKPNTATVRWLSGEETRLDLGSDWRAMLAWSPEG